MRWGRPTADDTRGQAEAPAAPAARVATSTQPAGVDGNTVAARPAGVPDAVKTAADWSWRLLLIGAALAVLLWLLVQVKVVVVPVAVAVLLAVLLSPVASWLHRRARLPRGAAVAVTLVGLVVLVAGLLTLAGRSIAKGIGQLWDKAVQGIDKVTSWLSAGPLHLSQDQLQQYANHARDLFSGGGGSSSIVSGALHATTTVAHVAAGTLIALFCTFFFMLDGLRIWAWVVGVLPRASRERVHQAGRRGLVTLGAYTRTQILVAAVDAITHRLLPL